MATAFSRRFLNLIRCGECSGRALGPCLVSAAGPAQPAPPGPKDNLLYKSAVSKQFTSQSFRVSRCSLCQAPGMATTQVAVEILTDCRVI